MKTKLWLATFLFLLTLNIHATDSQRDGNWGRDLTPPQKSDYTVGFMDGMQLGHKFSYWAFTSDERKKDCFIETTKSFESYSAKYFENVTNNQLADGLDSFYSDYRNRSVSLDDAVWLVANSIAGTPQNKLDKMIENFRRNVNRPKQ